MWQKSLIFLVVAQLVVLIKAQVCNTAESADPSIIVLGAGAAGISAVSKLVDNGFTKVTLLEAENRIGGRINTVPFASNVVDLGAQWVHGEVGNVVYQLVAAQKVLDKTPEDYFVGQYLNSQGNTKPEYEDLEVVMEDITDNSETAITGVTGSLGDFYKKQYWNKLKATDYRYIDNDTANEFLGLFERLQSFEDGSENWLDTAASGYNEFYTCDGYDLWNWKDQGYKTLFDFITVSILYAVISHSHP
jgi:spermine oxidase